MIPVDFLLRANSAQFTRAVASAENRVRGLKKSLASFGGGNIGALIGIAGLVRGFQATLSYAQDLRREAEGLGKPIDEATASVARLADGFQSIGTTLKGFGVQVVGIFTQVGEAIGDVINTNILGRSIESQMQIEKIEKQTKETLDRIAKAREENSPAKIAEAERKLASIKRENELRAADAETKLKMLTDDRLRIEKEIASLAPNTVASKEKQIELAKLERDIADATKDVESEKADAAERQAKAQEQINELKGRQAELAGQADQIKREEAVARADRILPSIEDLAARAEKNEQMRANYGIGAEGSLVDALDPNDPAVRAKRALELEAQARDAALSGDAVARLQDAPRFQAEAEELRRSLAGSVQSRDSNIGDQFKDALAETNKELAEIREALKGVIKAQ